MCYTDVNIVHNLFEFYHYKALLTNYD